VPVQAADGEVTTFPAQQTAAPSAVRSGPDARATRHAGPLAPGASFGRYSVIKLLGVGGMGAVYQAWDNELGVAVALKVIRPEVMADPSAERDLERRFKRELLLARQVTHKSVVRIHDLGEIQGIKYITMSFVDGEDLSTVLRREGKLPVGRVLAIAREVVSGMQAAHEAGVVHRDLKPDNIFLCRDDDAPYVVKILDFGVAKQTSNTIDGSNTKTGAMLGTPYYMSPEQAQGVKSVDSKSDLWSLAVIVFQCLTGRLPFESEALGDLLVKIIVSPIPVPSTYNPGVPSGFDQWFLKAADRNPENRFPTAKAFSESLILALGQSAMTDIMDRNKLLKMGGGTALMSQGVVSNVPNTPFPGQGTAALPNTPNPYSHQTPAGVQVPSGNAASSPGNVSTGATFSGVEPPAALPKKGPPIAVLVGVGALALIGVALGGFAMLKGKGAQASADPSPSASVAAAGATSEPKPADPTPTAELAPTTVVAPSAAPSAAASAPATAGAAPAVAAGAGAGGHTVAAKQPAAQKAPVAAASIVAAPPPAQPPPAKPPAPAPTKKNDLGF
jgi:serine/threonine-protein kinase